MLIHFVVWPLCLYIYHHDTTLCYHFQIFNKIEWWLYGTIYFLVILNIASHLSQQSLYETIRERTFDFLIKLRLYTCGKLTFIPFLQSLDTLAAFLTSCFNCCYSNFQILDRCYCITAYFRTIKCWVRPAARMM